ncbi:MAG: hypothetical protein KTR16_03350 [Acidiferrobacterales bacterium]|nr:hypothetical protein [Acidiferrobacterales bacterium]
MVTLFGRANKVTPVAASDNIHTTLDLEMDSSFRWNDDAYIKFIRNNRGLPSNSTEVR